MSATLHPNSRRASEMRGQHAQLSMWIRCFGPSRRAEARGWERKKVALEKGYLALVGQKISEK